MSPGSDPTELQPDWDGHCLRVRMAPGLKLVIDIDGCRFIDLLSDQDGLAEFGLPFSPSGNTGVDIQLTSQADHQGTTRLSFGIEMNSPGICSANAAIHPLRALRDVELLVSIAAEPMQREVAIVVPVYNAPEDVERCLDSVLAHTSGSARLIVIDDASTDARIAPLLDRYRGMDGVEILANDENLGFTATVNRGIAIADRADVVLLNADAEVAANWLTGLRRALHSGEDIATVTAVSDNAGAFSVPELEQENPFPDAWGFAQAALALWQNAGLAYPQLPTGNGFCLLIRREVIERIGAFDVEAFAQGYGEENDFCQRACASGYRHLIAGNVLVRHARSRSFGHERRAALGQAGMQVLRKRWPRYEADVGNSLFSFERRVLDWRVRRIYLEAATNSPQPRLLVVGFDEEIEPSNGYDMHMIKQIDSGFALSRPNHPPLETSTSLDVATVACWLQRYAIDRIAIHTDVDSSISATLMAQARRLGIALLESFAATSSAPEQIEAQVSRQRSFGGSAT